MKNIQNVFCIRSPIASRPYYIMSNSDGINKIVWTKEPGFHLCEPNDMDPFLPSYDDDGYGEHDDYLKLVSHISKNRMYQNVEPTLVSNFDEQPILQINSPLSPSFLCTPYFPFDLFLHNSTEDVSFTLFQRMQSKDKKLKRATEDLHISVNKTIKSKRFTDDSQVFFQRRNLDDMQNEIKNQGNPDSPSSSIPGLPSLIKNIKKFIVNDNLDDYQYPSNLINLIKKSDDLLIECIYQLISLLDTTHSSTSVIQSWKLMMLIVGFFPIPNPHSENLQDFLICAAGHDEVDYEIQYRAKICLCRVFSEYRLNIPWTAEEQNYKYIKASMSMTQLFGVSLAEIIVKEEYKRVRSPIYNSKSYNRILKTTTKVKKNNNAQTSTILLSDDNDFFDDCLNKIPDSSLFGYKSEDNEEAPVLVPLILKKLIKAMISMNCFKFEGIFRTVGDKLVENQTVDDINDGYWEEPVTILNTIASITKRFLRELQDPLIPNYIINMATPTTPPYKIIQQINQLPCQNKETLMYFVGFLQQIADNYKVNKMNFSNLAISLGSMFNDYSSNEIENPKERLDKIGIVVRTMINYWNTSPVYDL